jgi:hypothetical protein
MMIDGFVALLIADPTTNALVQGRVTKNVLARGSALPAIAVHRYMGDQEYDLNGPVDVREDQIQFDVYVGKADAEQLTEVVRNLVINFTGALPDGTLIYACYLERDMDMPFLPNADVQGIAARSTLGYRVVSKRI